MAGGFCANGEIDPAENLVVWMQIARSGFINDTYGGTVGAAVAAKAAPDGYTWFLGAVHHTIAPSMYPKLSYDLERDFIPLALLASVPQVVVVNPKKVTHASLQALAQDLRANPGKPSRMARATFPPARNCCAPTPPATSRSGRMDSHISISS